MKGSTCTFPSNRSVFLLFLHIFKTFPFQFRSVASTLNSLPRTLLTKRLFQSTNHSTVDGEKYLCFITFQALGLASCTSSSALPLLGFIVRRLPNCAWSRLNRDFIWSRDGRGIDHTAHFDDGKMVVVRVMLMMVLA